MIAAITSGVMGIYSNRYNSDLYSDIMCNGNTSNAIISSIPIIYTNARIDVQNVFTIMGFLLTVKNNYYSDYKNSSHIHVYIRMLLVCCLFCCRGGIPLGKSQLFSIVQAKHDPPTIQFSIFHYIESFMWHVSFDQPRCVHLSVFTWTPYRLYFASSFL